MGTSFKVKRRGASLISGFPRIVALAPLKGLRILTFHALGNPVDGDANLIYNMSGDEFAAQLDAILQFSHRYEAPIVPFGSDVENGIVLTFDDGYEDLLTVALPLLSRHSIPFHVFITPERLTSGDRRYLSTSQLLKLAESDLVTIGAHGYEHRALTQMPHDEVKQDLLRSRSSLQELLGVKVTSMSYPFGMVNEGVRDLVESAGFTLAASSKWGFNGPSSDKLMLRRIDMWSGDSPSVVCDKLSGFWNWFSLLT